MTEKISFEKELNDLRKAGFTESQIKAIWKLTLRVAVVFVNKISPYDSIVLESERSEP